MKVMRKVKKKVTIRTVMMDQMMRPIWMTRMTRKGMTQRMIPLPQPREAGAMKYAAVLLDGKAEHPERVWLRCHNAAISVMSGRMMHYLGEIGNVTVLQGTVGLIGEMESNETVGL